MEDKQFVDVYIRESLPEYNFLTFNDHKIKVSSVCEQKKFYDKVKRDYIIKDDNGHRFMGKINNYISQLEKYEC